MFYGGSSSESSTGLKKGDGSPRVPRGSYGVGLWKEICKEALQLKLNSEFVVGEGSRVGFWEDVWCGLTFFATLFHVVIG